MKLVLGLVLAALSIWDYPARQFEHERLRNQFISALREGDTETMIETCEKGTKLLPDDPTWHYNLACSLAYKAKPDAALDELEKAIDLGFRDANQISIDSDLKRIADNPRFKELIEYAKSISEKPILLGPMANVDATGVFGKAITLGEQNMAWDFDAGAFIARLKLAPGVGGASSGDIYMNRDNGHSQLKVEDFPGITVIRLDNEAHTRGMDRDIPNIIFPYPVFGNASVAYSDPTFWRSVPRSMMTTRANEMKAYFKFYTSNQLWFFPAHQDYPPVGKYGDVFMSISPYFWVSAGSSWSDQHYLRAALEASRNLNREVKKAIVAKGLLAPTIMTLMRKSLKGVTSEADYLSHKAHLSAFPAGGIDFSRLKQLAADLKLAEVPPLNAISVMGVQTTDKPAWPELTYVSPCNFAFVLRASDTNRTFIVNARGASEYAFRVVNAPLGAAKLTTGPQGDSAKLEINRALMSVTNRIDLAVFGRNPGTGWGAPSYVSFAVVDPTAAYSDPVLTPKQ